MVKSLKDKNDSSISCPYCNAGMFSGVDDCPVSSSVNEVAEEESFLSLSDLTIVITL